jgi:hypothetical protein
VFQSHDVITLCVLADEQALQPGIGVDEKLIAELS